MCHTYLFITTAALLIAAPNAVHATKPLAPAQPYEFVGAWHGYDDAGVEFMRLELGKSGRGLMAVVEFPDVAPEVYRVRWRQTSPGSYALLVHAVPANHTTEPVKIEGVSFTLSAISLQLRGKDWGSRFILFNEKGFTQRAGAVRQALLRMHRTVR